MESESWRLVGAFVLVIANAFFVAGEYALVGARPGRIAGLAKRGGKAAVAAKDALGHINRYIAGIQLAITMAGIGLGWVGEQSLSKMLSPFFDGIGLHFMSTAIAFLLVTFLLVVLGELVPKYVTINSPERMLVRIIIPLNFVLLILRPLTAMLEFAGHWVLRPLGIDTRRDQRSAIAKDELAMIIQESRTAGEFDESHARVITKALNFTDLQADDVMIPRVDIISVDVDTPTDELIRQLAAQTHTRVVVVEDGDLDEVVGILHLQDFVRLLAGRVSDLRSAVRQAVFVPPNLSLERLIERMQTDKTQILIIRDEHGGTAGLLTLEDIVEEIFGELDDQVEHAQPRIQTWEDGRIVMRGDVRTDELTEYLGLDENPLPRESVSTIILDEIERTPKIGDSIETDLGLMRVVNMSRHRITRVSLTRP
ncbi:MAG: hemolysin family protein [Armatimonadota bacterium]|nr:hemolysin family protein [Armatimonadota bacterium]